MVTLINDHVLFPEPANWAELPLWERRWENAIGQAITGAESRTGLRAQPRVSLSFMVTLSEIVSLTQFDDRVRAAKKIGLACSPYHGRGYVLQNLVDGDTAELDRPWKASLGSYVFFANAADAYEVREVVAVDGNTITLDQVVARDYAARLFCWPLLFGKFNCEEMPAQTPKNTALKLTISELVSSATEQLGAVVPPGGNGIGVWEIGTTFEVQ